MTNYIQGSKDIPVQRSHQIEKWSPRKSTGKTEQTLIQTVKAVKSKGENEEEAQRFYCLDWICVKSDFVLQTQGAVSLPCESPSWSFLQEWVGIDEIASQNWLLMLTCSWRFSTASGPCCISKSCMCIWSGPPKWKKSLSTFASPAHGHMLSLGKCLAKGICSALSRY